MANILVVSPHFPTPDVYEDLANDPRSKFLYHYVTLWKSFGHEVTVLHVSPRYPKIFKFIANLADKLPLFNQLNLKRFIQNTDATSKKRFTHNNIEYFREPITKIIPHKEYSPKAIDKLLKNIGKSGFKKNDFDVIFADYLSPTLSILNRFNLPERTRIFPIIHQTDFNYLVKDVSLYSNLLRISDKIIYRSKPLSINVNSILSIEKDFSFMYSGIPDNINFSSSRNKITKLLYVGTLRKSKNIHVTLNAIASIRNKCSDFTFEIVGVGEYENELKELTKKLNIDDIVTFVGKLTHVEVFEKMKNSDALVMVSKETFGMVYVEAMSQGCVVIAAKDQGIDGVVTHNNNGLLAKLDDQADLENCLVHLLNMRSVEIESLSNNALNTAKTMKNSNLASAFLDDLKI